MKIGIIGGSGLDNPDLIQNFEEKQITTEFGEPSSTLTCGKIQDIEVCIIARHGKHHKIPPSEVNYRANLFALKQEGCTHILATTACGSLREEIKRGDFVILNQFIDFTKHRKSTFYEKFENEARHTAMSEPFSEFLREKIISCCKELNITHHEKGTVITIEGPRFSTRAESKMFRQWGADVINMSIAPEAALANELQIEYAAIAMSTDYDCWKQDEPPVTWEQILKVFNENSEKMKKLLIKTIEKIATESISETDQEFIKSKIRTIPDFPKPGIMFRDITTLLKDSEGFNKAIDILVKRYQNKSINKVAGIESRGFIIGGILASKLNVPFIPIRKPGKLPSETLSQEYSLEYGTDKVEIHKDAISSEENVLLVDDLLATGGTSQASANLIEQLGGKIEEIAFIIELTDLKGREKLNKWNVFSIIEFEGE